MQKSQIRCAIYTRKSSEEGLEQSFNSLDAQREACQAYIASQRHEGWVALRTRYDDGGFSGGTMERPGLKRLLVDISEGKIDTLVVYKVDRLTRSLADFAKIIEVFDKNKVSFVAVTQQFNTTTSMGRLTLNVLLSFAQFEREVTGERIRDKIAASKKKGMWMGGNVPVGYELKNRKLLINDGGRKIVCEIFENYLRLGCVSKLKTYLDERGFKTPIRTAGSGRTTGGHPFSRGALYKILNNRLYLGEIHHGGQIYAGEHEAIIDRELWDRVAAKLEANNQAHRERRTGSDFSSPLAGLLFDAAGFRYTPTHAVKAGKRYRYYTSQAVIRRVAGATGVSRIPAQDLEKIVRANLQSLLATPDRLFENLPQSPEAEALRRAIAAKVAAWPQLSVGEQNDLVRKLVTRIVVGQSTLSIRLSRRSAFAVVSDKPSEVRHRRLGAELGPGKGIELVARIHAGRIGGTTRVISPDNDLKVEPVCSMPLVKAIVRARAWYEKLALGEVQTIRALAKQTGMTHRYISRILMCASLSPKLVEAILEGRQPAGLTLESLRSEVPLAWSEQGRCSA